jgi:hypothetical protein
MIYNHKYGEKKFGKELFAEVKFVNRDPHYFGKLDLDPHSHNLIRMKN